MQEQVYPSLTRLDLTNINQYLKDLNPKDELREVEEYFRRRDELRRTLRVPQPPELL